MKQIETTLVLQRDGKEIECTIIANFRRGTPDTYYEPGDPDEVEIISCKDPNRNEVLNLFEDEEERIVDKVINQVADSYIPEYEPDDKVQLD